MFSTFVVPIWHWASCNTLALINPEKGFCYTFVVRTHSTTSYINNFICSFDMNNLIKSVSNSLLILILILLFHSVHINNVLSSHYIDWTLADEISSSCIKHIFVHLVYGLKCNVPYSSAEVNKNEIDVAYVSSHIIWCKFSIYLIEKHV